MTQRPGRATSISAALIVRDEAQHLGACLASVSGAVDEVVVVDTGSVDDTRDIARAHGARLIEHPWADDFAAARNIAVDAATGAWILYIDADERFAADPSLHDVLGAPGADDVVAGLVRFRAASRFTPYLEHRLFRNRPDLRFRGRIHETILPDIARITADEGARVVEVPASIEHLGYEGDLTHKHRRNLPILEAQVQRDPMRTYLWFDLGAARQGLGDVEGAEAAWATGVESARRQPRLAAIDLLVCTELALVRLRSGRDADDVCELMARDHPDDPLTRWVRANRAMGARRWDEAAALLEGLVAEDPGSVRHETLAYDTRIFGVWGHHALGVCAFHRGDAAGAVHWFGLAAAAEPDDPEIRVKLQLARARAGVERTG